jgi:hypothetical protein
MVKLDTTKCYTREDPDLDKSGPVYMGKYISSQIFNYDGEGRHYTMIHTFEKGKSEGAEQPRGTYGTAPDWVKEVPCQSAGRRKTRRRRQRGGIPPPGGEPRLTINIPRPVVPGPRAESGAQAPRPRGGRRSRKTRRSHK